MSTLVSVGIAYYTMTSIVGAGFGLIVAIMLGMALIAE